MAQFAEDDIQRAKDIVAQRLLDKMAEENGVALDDPKKVAKLTRLIQLGKIGKPV